MHQAIDPVGEARNDFDIFARSRPAPRLRRGVCRGARRDGMAAAPLRPVPRARAEQSRPRVRHVLGEGLGRDPAASEEYVLFADFSADPEKHKLRTPSGRIELYSDGSPGSAMMIARRTRPGSSRRNGSAPIRRRVSAASGFEPAAAQTAQPDGCRPGQRAGQDSRTRDAGDQPGRCPPARHRGWRGGTRIQRPGRVFCRCRGYRRRAAGGGPAVLRRLVRPGKRCRRCALRARQCECPDMRPRHLAARARGRARRRHWSKSSTVRNRRRSEPLCRCICGERDMPEPSEDLFEIIATTRSMRRLKPDPVPPELIRQDPRSRDSRAVRRQHAALALPRRHRPQGQADGRGLLQAGLGRGCSALATAQATRLPERAPTASGECSTPPNISPTISTRPPSGSCPAWRRQPDPHGRLVDLPGGAEHAAGGASARSRRDIDDLVPDNSKRRWRPRSACRPTCIHMRSCRSAIRWAGSGRFGECRLPRSSTATDGVSRMRHELRAFAIEQPPSPSSG